MLYHKRWAGTDSTFSLIFLLNVNLALHLFSHKAGYSPAQPFLWPFRVPPAHHSSSWKRGAHLQILGIQYQVPKAAFPSLAAGSAARCSNGLKNSEMQQLLSFLCHQPESSLLPWGQPSLKPRYQQIKYQITANYLHCDKGAVILVRLSSSWPSCPAARVSFIPRL